MTEIIDKFWFEDPLILFRIDRFLEFFISQDQSISEKLNSIARFGVYISIVLTLYHKNIKYLTLSLLTFIITYLIYINLNTDGKNKISLQRNTEEYTEVNTEVNTEVDTEEYIKPTINNPFGNSSVIDIIDNPDRKPMVDYSEYSDKTLKVKEDIEKTYNYNLYKDLDDVYGKQNSQRQFYTTPSRGTIPSDPRGEFKHWLYGKMPSCKDNTYECINSMFETPRRKTQIFPNQLVNPVNIEARKSVIPNSN